MARKQARYDVYNDYYQLLGIPVDADAEQIQHAFRARAKAVHPDLNPDRAEWAKEQFQKLNEAQTLLMDDSLRTAYDQQRRRYFPGDRYRARDDWWNKPHPVTPSKAESNSHAGQASGATEDPFAASSPPFNMPPVRPYTPPRPISRSFFSGPYRYVVVLVTAVLALNVGFMLYYAFVTRIAISVQETSVAQSFNTQAVPGLIEATIVAAPLPRRTPGALQPVCPPNVDVTLTDPPNYREINTDEFAIHGTAAGERFVSYMVEIISLDDLVRGELPARRYTLIHPVSYPVRDGLLGTATIKNMQEGRYLLRLNVLQTNPSETATCEILIIRKP